MTRRYLQSVLLAGALVAGLSAAPALADSNYPNRPVRVVVPLTPGSGADIVARTLAKSLEALWRQPVIIENKPGAGGTIGTREVVSAPADGYTLLIQSASHAANPAIYKSLPYDPTKDLIDVALLATSPYVLVSAMDGPYQTVKAIVDAAKVKPQAVPFASAGMGTASHLVAELFAMHAKLDMLHIPFKGSPDAITDVAGGRTAFYMAPLSTVRGMLNTKLRPVAVTSAERAASLPSVPTVAESGYPDVKVDLWIGMWAPAGTPDDVIQKLAKDVSQALQSPELQATYAAAGNQVRLMSPVDFAQFVRKDIDTNKQLVKQANITPQ
ncbi:Bug family tripartite tricarboxylate transporter substrate binding protein [Paracandidimonas soli]|uniref:Tripartite-type tricarboxylate transporter receptor subunit TctC n=1 Tax=Paracandidimonas soli TaxID=1917182 RepID=A0A4R3UV38_9BURK|nr:tripartite tricarboxylate transporter substrate binding protein [Paracandidimonas soli]TCU96005.1 tripartite-type tricarboxylate transporter receptor subunit TctC [Paracandidimonas soli]